MDPLSQQSDVNKQSSVSEQSHAQQADLTMTDQQRPEALMATPAGVEPVKTCPNCRKHYPASYEFCPDDATTLIPLNSASESSIKIRTKIGIVWLISLCLVGGLIIKLRSPHAGAGSNAGSHVVSAAALPSTPILGSEPASPIHASPAQTSGISYNDGSRNSVPDRPSGWQHYENRQLGFQMDYPVGWKASAKVMDAQTIRVTYSSPNPNVLALVDVSSAANAVDPQQSFAELDLRFRRAYRERYHFLSMGSESIDGRPAAEWSFILEKKGQPSLEREDFGTAGNGHAQAVLFVAPPAEFASWGATFQNMRQSIRWIS